MTYFIHSGLWLYAINRLRIRDTEHREVHFLRKYPQEAAKRKETADHILFCTAYEVVAERNA